MLTFFKPFRFLLDVDVMEVIAIHDALNIVMEGVYIPSMQPSILNYQINSRQCRQ